MFIKNNSKVTISLLVGVLLIVSGWFTYQQWFIPSQPDKIVTPINIPKSSPPPTTVELTTPEKKQLSLQWQPGDRQTYQYLLQAKIKTNIGLAATTPSWQEMDLKVQGMLNMRVFKPVTQGQFIGFQLSPTEVTFSGQSVPQFEELFQTFFVAIFSPEGKPLRFHFPANISPNDQPLLAEIINAVQAVVSSQNKKQWEIEEKHNTGHYRARYTVDKGKINKQKLLYTSVTSQNKNNLHKTNYTSLLNAKIKKSQAKIELSKKKSWLKQFDGHGEVEVYADTTIVSTNSYLINLTASNTPLNSNLAIWQAPDDPNEVLAIFAKQQGISKDVLANLEQQGLKKKFAHTNVKELTDNIILATLNNESPGELSAHFIQLAEYLRAYPEHARHVLQQLQANNVPLKASGTLISALQTAGTPEAQYVLADMISGAETVNPAYMFQGLITTTMVSQPLPELVDALWTQLENAEIDGMSDLSLLVLGAASNNLQKTGESEQATEIDQHLFDYLQENTDNENATFDEETVLRSLGNTGRTDLLSAVEPFFNAETPKIRAVAYKSLRHADDVQSREKLVTALREDKELKVRTAVLETLVKRPDNNKSVEAVRQQIANEQNEGLRTDMLRFIGANKTNNPKVVETLQQQLEIETSRHMKKEVYRSLFAE